MRRSVRRAPDGLAATTGRPGKTVLAVAVALGAALAALTVPSFGALAWSVVGVCVGAGVVTVLAARHLGGYTGDVLGAAIIAAEATALVLLASPGLVIRA